MRGRCTEPTCARQTQTRSLFPSVYPRDTGLHRPWRTLIHLLGTRFVGRRTCRQTSRRPFRIWPSSWVRRNNRRAGRRARVVRLCPRHHHEGQPPSQVLSRSHVALCVRPLDYSSQTRMLPLSATPKASGNPAPLGSRGPGWAPDAIPCPRGFGFQRLCGQGVRGAAPARTWLAQRERRRFAGRRIRRSKGRRVEVQGSHGFDVRFVFVAGLIIPEIPGISIYLGVLGPFWSLRTLDSETGVQRSAYVPRSHHASSEIPGRPATFRPHPLAPGRSPGRCGQG